MKKTFLAVTIMIFTVIFALAINAESGKCGENVNWELDNLGTLTISGTGDMGEYYSNMDIPWYNLRQNVRKGIVEDGVTSICSGCFSDCQNLTYVSIGKDVSTIGNVAFSYCSSLENIAVSDDNKYYTAVDDVLFTKDMTELIIASAKKEGSYTVPNDVKKIDGYAFEGCNITSVNIPDGVIIIENSVFVDCYNLSEITIPDTVLSIGWDCFLNCSRNFVIKGYDGNYAEDYAKIYNIKFESLGASTRKVVVSGECGENVNWELDNLGTLTISGTGDMGYYVWVKLPWYNLRENVKKGVIEDGVTSVCSYCFYHCSNLTGVRIGKDVSSIGDNVFSNCFSLKNIDVSGDNKYYTAVDDVLFTKDMTELIIASAKKEGSYTVPNDVKKIAGFAFVGCGITSVTFPDGVIIIGDCAFMDCNNLSIATIPDTVLSIGGDCFLNCSRNFVIKGYDGNYAEEYAKIYNIKFESLGASTRKVVVSGECGENVKWELDNLGTLTISGDGDMYEYHSSDDIPWSSLRQSVRKGVIEDGITSISFACFFDCNNLSEVRMPDTLCIIERDCFRYCNENLVIYGYEGTFAETYAKENNIKFESLGVPTRKVVVSGECGENVNWELDNLGTLTISGTGDMGEYYSNMGIPWYNLRQNVRKGIVEDGVTSICSCCFSYCQNLTYVSIGKDVSTIGNVAFSYCSSLENIAVSDDNKYYTAIDGVLFTKDITKLVIVPAKKEDDYNVPGCVVKIDDHAFEGCNITSVNIPDGVFEIGDLAFNRCENLLTVTIPDTVLSIGWDCFWYCNENLVIYGYDGTVAETYAKEYNIKFESLGVLAKKVIASGKCGENGDNILWELNNHGELTITGSGRMAHHETPWKISFPIKKITLGNGITNIVPMAFADTDIEEFQIPETVTEIGYEAFRRCVNLKSIVIPDSIEMIDSFAFDNCTSLTEAHIGKGVSGIPNGIFNTCPSLKTITLDPQNESLVVVDGVLYDREMTQIIAYPSADGRTEYTVPDSVSYANGVFSENDTLKTFTIGKSLSGFDTGIFSSFTALECINVSKENERFSSENGVLFVKNKEALICYPCRRSGSSYTIPDSVSEICYKAFFNCGNLESITIPSSVKNIGFYAFEGCVSLKEITVPGSVGMIPSSCFANCQSLESVVLEEGITEIGSFAFEGCYSLKSLTVSPSVSGIEYIGDLQDNGLTIYGYEGSAAEDYAKNFGYNFVSTGKMIKVTGIKLDPEKLTMEIGESKTITAIIAPSDATNKRIRWSTSNYNVAGVFDDGTVVANRAGQAVITAMSYDGTFVAECEVTVKFPTPSSEKRDGNEYKAMFDYVSRSDRFFGGLKGDFVYDTMANHWGGDKDVPANEFESEFNKLFEEYVVEYMLPQFRELFNYDPETQVYHVICSGGFGGNIPARKFIGYVDLGDKCEFYFATIEYDWLPWDIYDKLDEYLQPDGTVIYGGNTYEQFMGNYYRITGIYQSGRVHTVSYNDGYIRFISTEEFNEYMIPPVFSDAVAAPEYIKADIDNAFETGTVVTINDENIDSTVIAKAEEAAEKITDKYYIFEINAEKDGQPVQPSGTVEIVISLPDGFSTTSAVYYLNNDGELERLDTVVNAEARTLTVKLTHFSTYLIIDETGMTDGKAGDANNDGVVDISDAVLLAQHLALWKVKINLTAADCNGDGNVDINDAVLLAQYLADWKVTLGK